MLERVRKARKGQKRGGFTLIELLIVIVIIGILASIVLPRIMGGDEPAIRATMEADLKNAESVERLYYASVVPHQYSTKITVSGGNDGATAPVDADHPNLVISASPGNTVVVDPYDDNGDGLNECLKITVSNPSINQDLVLDPCNDINKPTWQ